jgi:hypothetical protein
MNHGHSANLQRLLADQTTTGHSPFPRATFPRATFPRTAGQVCGLVLGGEVGGLVGGEVGGLVGGEVGCCFAT